MTARLLVAAVVVTMATCLVGTPALATDATTQRALRSAEAMATEAKALFQNKAYGEAARLFMEAYAVIKRPTLVYNAARARQEGGELKRAESLFLMYRGLPGASARGRADALAHLTQLRARLKSRQVAAAAAKASAGTRRDPPSGQRTTRNSGLAATVSQPAMAPATSPSWPWLGGLGGAVALASGVAYGVAYSIASDLDVTTVRSPTSAASYADRRDSARLWRGVAVGGGVVSAGLLGWALWRAMNRPRAVASRAQPATLGLSAGLPRAGVRVGLGSLRATLRF